MFQVNVGLSLHLLSTVEQRAQEQPANSVFLSGGQNSRFNHMASEGKYLDLSMESSSDSPFPVVAWGWMGPQGK